MAPPPCACDAAGDAGRSPHGTLLYVPRSRSLFEELKKDIASVSPETEVVGVEIAIRNPWDFEEVLRLPARFRPQPTFHPKMKTI